MKTILITGGAGFIGSNFVHYFLKAHPDIRVVNLDLLTYAGSLENLEEVLSDPRHIFVKGDITDAELVNSLFRKYDIRGVIHFAAESHVDNSIANPGIFVRTNVLGTYVLLDSAYRYWMEGPFKVRRGYEGCRFHHISTDEVYGSLGDEGKFREDTPYAPNSPYSASKAGSDMLVRSYHHTYGMNVVITNCSNNYGPRQHLEKFIPTVIRTALSGQAIPIYGRGENVRDWLYVEDHCEAIDLVFQRAPAGSTYNIGGENERRNIDVARDICRILDEIAPRGDGRSYAEQLTFVQDRPGHDWRYAMDISKIKEELGWRPSTEFSQGLRKTVEWFVRRLRRRKDDQEGPGSGR